MPGAKDIEPGYPDPGYAWYLVVILFVAYTNELRGQAIAIYIFIVALIGMNCGPTGVALITDCIFADPGAVRYSLAKFALVFGALTCLVLRSGIKPYLRSAAEMHRAAARAD